MNVIRPKHFHCVQSVLIEGKPKYYTNESESLWIRSTTFEGEVGVFRSGDNEWVYISMNEYDKLRMFLDTI